MPLQSGLTELHLAKGDLAQALEEGQRFLDVSLATAEHTWQALAWEVNARVALASRNQRRAKECISNAPAAIVGFQVPLAGWRVHATAAKMSRGAGSAEAAAGIHALADSLAGFQPLRRIFLTSAIVREIIAP